MKRAILTFAFCLLPFAFCYAAIVERGAVSGTLPFGVSLDHQESSYDLIYPYTINTGDFLVVGGSLYVGVPTTITVTSDCSSPLTVFSGDDGSFSATFIAYGFATSTGTCTVTVASSNTAFFTFGMDAFTGVNATPLDVDGGYTNSAGATAIEDITTVAANSLIIGVMGMIAARTITPDSSYTQIYEEEDGNSFQGFSMVFRIVPTPSTYSVFWNFSSGVDWSTYVASFKPAGAASGPVVRHRPIMQ